MTHPDVMREAVEYYLKTVRRLTTETRELDEKITMIESALTLKGVSFDDAGGGGSDDPLGCGIASLIELRAQWNALVSQCADEAKVAYRICSPIHPERWALWLYHVEGFRWEIVARKVGYSVQHMRRLAYGKGVQEIYDAMPEWARREAFPDALER